MTRNMSGIDSIARRQNLGWAKPAALS